MADLGCGTGTLAVLLGMHGYDVTGVDLSPRMIERARRKAADAAVEASFLVADASVPALPSAAFDVVLARHVVWALPDPADALRRWRRLLAPGGRFLLVEGFWAGGGLHAEHLAELLGPLADVVEVLTLTDPVLWGGPVADERYAAVGLT